MAWQQHQQLQEHQCDQFLGTFWLLYGALSAFSEAAATLGLRAAPGCEQGLNLQGSWGSSLQREAGQKGGCGGGSG